MAKSTATYWNAFSPEAQKEWAPIKGLEGMAEELTLSIDGGTGEYTRLTRFLPGADTSALGGKASDNGVGHSARSAKKHHAPHSAKRHFIPPRSPVSARIL
jgi:hypothetical protein